MLAILWGKASHHFALNQSRARMKLVCFFFIFLLKILITFTDSLLFCINIADICGHCVFCLSAPPTLDLDFRDKLIVRVGEAFSLTGRYSGKPAPKVTWLKDDVVVKEDDRIKIKTTPTTLCLGILKSVREDTGRYCVTVENSTGSRKGFCQVNVVGRFY